MSDQQQRPPYPPAPPYPQGGMPHPAGVPPYPPGVKMPVPPGMKIPPRPMGYPMPAGMKMPPRPAGVPPMGMPPPGAVPPAPVAGVPAPDFSETDQELETEENAEEPEVDENGFIDDLEPEPEPEEVVEENPYEHNMASDLGLPPAFVKTKVLVPLFFFFMVLGGCVGYFGSLLQGKSGGEMPGVVNNAEIPKGRPRCGIAQKGQGCVLYVMNAQRREMEGRDFFGMAADVLSIPRFQIETANIRYATMRIPPGYIALLNIPPMQ